MFDNFFKEFPPRNGSNKVLKDRRFLMVDLSPGADEDLHNNFLFTYSVIH